MQGWVYATYEVALVYIIRVLENLESPYPKPHIHTIHQKLGHQWLVLRSEASDGLCTVLSRKFVQLIFNSSSFVVLFVITRMVGPKL